MTVRIRLKIKDCEDIIRSCGYSIKTIKDLVEEIKFKSEPGKSAVISYAGKVRVAYKDELELMSLRAAIKNVALIEDFTAKNWDTVRNVYYVYCSGNFQLESIAESLLEDRVRELIRDKDF